MEKTLTIRKNKTIPEIIVNSDAIEEAISNWFGTNKKWNYRFGKILTKIGFSVNDIVILDNYNAKDLSFHYASIKYGISRYNRITLKFGHFMKSSPSLTITNSIATNTYALRHDNRLVELISYSIKNNNGNVYSRFLQMSWCDFKVENNDYKFNIYIEMPKKFEKKAFKELGFKYTLRDEPKLEEILMNLTFPFAIEDFFNKFSYCFLDSIADYPYLTMVIQKKDANDHYETTDLIELENGEITQFMVIRNKQIITLKDLGNWAQKKQKLAATNRQNNELKINTIKEQTITTICPAS